MKQTNMSMNYKRRSKMSIRKPKTISEYGEACHNCGGWDEKTQLHSVGIDGEEQMLPFCNPNCCMEWFIKQGEQEDE